jgi:hypothetical protein
MVSTLNTFLFLAMISYVLYSVSSRMNTCEGSRSEHHAVKPLISVTASQKKVFMRVKFEVTSGACSQENSRKYVHKTVASG